MTDADGEALRDPVGLCARCRHRREVTNRRGSMFHLCGLSATDPRYPKYPALPVIRCDGFEDASPDPGGGPIDREEE